jgi:hypothetical protein
MIFPKYWFLSPCPRDGYLHPASEQDWCHRRSARRPCHTAERFTAVITSLSGTICDPWDIFGHHREEP